MTLKELLDALNELSHSIPLDTEVVICHEFKNTSGVDYVRDLRLDNVYLDKRDYSSTGNVVVIDDISYMYAKEEYKEQYKDFPTFIEYEVVGQRYTDKPLPF